MQTTVLGDETLKQINNIIFKYIWSKREQDSQNTDVKVMGKVKRECIIQNYANHGLNMIDAVYMLETMTISWIRKLSNKCSRVSFSGFLHVYSLAFIFF